MVGMTVIAVGRKCDDDLRHDPADVSSDLCDRFGMICAIDLTVEVVEEVQPFHPQLLNCVLQLLLTYLTERVRAWILVLGTEPAALPARRADEMSLHPFGRVLCKCAAHPHRFVVRVGEDGQQTQISHSGPLAGHAETRTGIVRRSPGCRR